MAYVRNQSNAKLDYYEGQKLIRLWRQFRKSLKTYFLLITFFNSLAGIWTHSRTSNFQIVAMFYAPSAFKVEQNAAAIHENANFLTSTQKWVSFKDKVL